MANEGMTCQHLQEVECAVTMTYKEQAPPTDRSILPTAPRAAWEPSIDRSRLPKSPPNTAFLGNLPYDVIEESVKEFFRGLNISAVRLPREPSNPERLKGLAYAAFEDLDFLLSALSLSEESLGNTRIRVDVADQAQDKDRDEHSFGRDGNRDSDKTDTDWRARSATDSFDDYSPRRGDDSFGDKCRDGYDSDRDDDYRGSGDRYEDQYDRQDDESWSSRDEMITLGMIIGMMIEVPPPKTQTESKASEYS
ncbi:hypothetical protein H8959_010555 [Pygathrix nigripes]